MDYTQIATRLQKLSTEVDIRKEKINILKENGIPFIEDKSSISPLWAIAIVKWRVSSSSIPIK